MPANKIVAFCLGLSVSFSASADRYNAGTEESVNMFRVSFADTLTPIDAQRISRRAAALVNEQGRTRALSRFSKLDGGFLEKDGFVFCMTLAGVVVSHPVRPQLVGRNLLDHRRYGQYLFQDMVRVAKNTGEGWVEYNWPYPGTSKLRPKMSYVVRNKEGFLCSVAAFK